MEHVRASAVKRVSTFLARLAKVLFFFVVFALSTNLVFFSMFESLRYLYRLPRKLYLLSKGSLPFWLVWLTLLRYAFCCFFRFVEPIFFFSKKKFKFLVWLFLACSSKCSSCDGHPDKCLTCKLRLSSGGCVSTCPKGTIEVDGHCINCHGDCDTCTGLSYNECSSCREDRPVLSNGRCFRTCSKKSEYFDYSSNSCQTCDASCSSCTDAGPSHCLACSNSTDVLQDGGCSPRKSGELVLLGMDFGK